MKVISKKQVVALCMVVLIIVAGVLQYTYSGRDKLTGDEQSNNSNLGEGVFVSDSVLDDSNDNTALSVEAISYFSQARLDNEVSIDSNVEALKSITNDVNASADIKDKAYERMMSLIDVSDKQDKLETLIKEKGFKEVLIIFSDDGSIDVIVGAASLSDNDVAQITDIVSRQAVLDADKIHIRNIS